MSTVARDKERVWKAGMVPGLRIAVLWENPETGATANLLHFAAGSGPASSHKHPCNQLMYCLRGRFRYASGVELGPNDLCVIPVGELHGPAHALEETVVLQIFDGRQ